MKIKVRSIRIVFSIATMIAIEKLPRKKPGTMMALPASRPAALVLLSCIRRLADEVEEPEGSFHVSSLRGSPPRGEPAMTSGQGWLEKILRREFSTRSRGGLRLPVFPDLLLPRRAPESDWFIRSARRRRTFYAFFDLALRRGAFTIFLITNKVPRRNNFVPGK